MREKIITYFGRFTSAHDKICHNNLAAKPKLVLVVVEKVVCTMNVGRYPYPR